MEVVASRPNNKLTMQVPAPDHEHHAIKHTNMNMHPIQNTNMNIMTTLAIKHTSMNIMNMQKIKNMNIMNMPTIKQTRV